MVRNTMLISLPFHSLNSERYAEDNKVHLKAKNKEMCHYLHMQIRCQIENFIWRQILKKKSEYIH